MPESRRLVVYCRTRPPSPPFWSLSPAFLCDRSTGIIGGRRKWNLQSSPPSLGLFTREAQEPKYSSWLHSAYTSGAALSLPEEFQSLVVVQDIYSSGQKVCPRYSLGGLRSWGLVVGDGLRCRASWRRATGSRWEFESSLILAEPPCRVQSACYVIVPLVELIQRRNNQHLSWSWRQGKSQPESFVEDKQENVGEDEHEDDADPSREEEKPPWKAVGSQNVQEDLWSSMPFLDNSMTSNLIWDVSKAAFHQSFTVFCELTRRRTRFEGWDPETNDGAFQTLGSHKLIESRVVDVQEGPIEYSIYISYNILISRNLM